MLTAVELGPDTCVLVRAALRGGDVRVSAIELLDPKAYPDADAFASALKQARDAHRLPRHAQVVLWGTPAGTGPRDPSVVPVIAPLTAAGFRVHRVVSPCDALAALARLRTPRPDAAIAWMAIDRRAVAIVVARPGELLYSHAFKWDSSVGARGSQARLLQRYSLVAFLAPEVRRASAAARARGARVEAVVTCGNLPDLRPLTMPLIEELDLEVETLDSLDGLIVAPELRDRASDLAPAIRLACAGVAARAARLVDAPQPSRLSAGAGVAAAALIATACGLGWLWYAQRSHRSQPAAATASHSTAAPPSTKSTSSPLTVAASAPEARRAIAPAARDVSSASAPPVAKPSAPQLATQGARRPAAGSGATALPQVAAPEVTATGGSSSAARADAARTQAPDASPQGTTVPSPPPAAPEPTPSAGDRVAGSPPSIPSVSPPPVLMAPARRQAHGGGAPATGRSQPQQKSELLDEPLPKVSTILVAEDRRLAMIDGKILGVGDAVGRRVIAAIEPRAVILREPSGAQIRVRLGGPP